MKHTRHLPDRACTHTCRAAARCAIFQVDASAAAAASEAAFTNPAIKIATNLDHLSGRHLDFAVDVATGLGVPRVT